MRPRAPGYDESAATLLKRRVLAFLKGFEYVTQSPRGTFADARRTSAHQTHQGGGEREIGRVVYHPAVADAGAAAAPAS